MNLCFRVALFGAQTKKEWGPQKDKQKEDILSTNDDLGRLSRFPDFFFGGSCFRKINGFYSSWDGALAKNSEDQPGGPRNNLEVFGDEVSFQYFQKTRKSTSPMPCKTKPGQSSRGSHRMVHAHPPDTPRPPKYHSKLLKNRFLWKSRFVSFSAGFVVFLQL